VEGVSALGSYLRNPVGRYLCGPTYVVWWKSERLNGIVLWGRPVESHLERITQALDAELAPGVRSHASLIDARRVWAIDSAAFEFLLRYVGSRREQFKGLVERQALLRPEGLAGAAIAGFYAVLTPSYPVRVFTETAPALEWLGEPQEHGAMDELDRIVLQLSGGSEVVALLRAYLERSLGLATIVSAAEAMHTSARNLQRKLREAGTSFQSELNSVQVRVAKTLMLDTSHDLKRVAAEVGCASLQNFSSLFKKLEGQSPSEWRVRQLAGARLLRASNA
jgi:AraC-like DNA-binding protein